MIKKKYLKKHHHLKIPKIYFIFEMSFPNSILHLENQSGFLSNFFINYKFTISHNHFPKIILYCRFSYLNTPKNFEIRGLNLKIIKNFKIFGLN